MATGRSNHLTKQTGEYLVAAELSRRGFIATTFTGNVPFYDIVAVSLNGHTALVQVKAIASGAWQLNFGKFADVRFDGPKQIVQDSLPTPAGILSASWSRSPQPMLIVPTASSYFRGANWARSLSLVIRVSWRSTEGCDRETRSRSTLLCILRRLPTGKIGGRFWRNSADGLGGTSLPLKP